MRKQVYQEKCFFNTKSFETSCNKFFKSLNKKLHKCFQKIRSKNVPQKMYGDRIIQSLLEIQSRLSNIKSNCSFDKSNVISLNERINRMINSLEAAKNRDKVKKHLEELTVEDKLNHTGFWKLKRKLCPRSQEQPSAKRDSVGNIVTAPQALKNLYLETYRKRLSHREMKIDFHDLLHLKTQLWVSRLNHMKGLKSLPWTMRQLETVLKSLKNNKSRDPNGMLNELFKEGIIGSDLKIALLHLFNGIKSSQIIPEFMKLSNITSLYKNKGSRSDLENDRGIFILTVLRKILDKLLYNDNYDSIDQNMSESNIGARKRRNIRDHLFVIYGIINSVLKGGEKCIDLQVYDIEKCFDALWLEECLNDLYNTLPEDHRNDQIALLYKANESNLVAVKTPAGLTSRINIPFIVQQGGTWGSLLCANTIDSFGKYCRDNSEFTYSYKNKTDVLPFAFIDDLNGIAECGQKSFDLNLFLSTKIELKRLRGGAKKCLKMHIGKHNALCPTLKIHDQVMTCKDEITYLGDIITADGKNTKNIQNRISKGLGQINQIFSILESMSFGTYTFEIALLLRNSLLLNGILTNSEVWYCISKSELDNLENLDKIFFMKLFGAPRTTPAAAFYLESGVIPLSIVIQVRRLMYLHNILLRPRTEVLYKVFLVQWHYPTAGDWVEQVKKDMIDLNIECDLSQISNMSKTSFKALVKKKAMQYAFSKLTEKKNTYKKLENLVYDQLEPQSYLNDEKITLEEKKLIFQFRTRMINVGNNYKAGRSSVICPLCSLHFDNQDDLLLCPAIRSKIKTTVNLNDIYESSISMKSAKLLKEVMNLRENLLA